MSLEIGLNIEGQEGVSWPQWVDLAEVAEEHGFAALYRSDHYLSEQNGSGRGALDAWGTICGLAAKTARIRLGTLVSPVTFRHPSVLAKLAVTADHISRGRVDVGIGAGWYENEHAAYGFALPELPVRLEMLAEQLEIVSRSWGPDTFTFHGRHYDLWDNDARPKPLATRPRLILGGSGRPRSVALAARWADEYNVGDSTPEEVRQLSSTLASACEDAGRDPATLRLSMLTGVVSGNDAAEIDERARRVAAFIGLDPDRTAAGASGLPKAWLIGRPEEIVERVSALEAAGLARLMLWPPLHDDLEMIALIGSAVLPAVDRS